MSPQAARLQFITCPYCKSRQYFLYPNTKKLCAEPFCAKEFDIIYNAELLKQIVDQLLKDIDSGQVSRVAAPQKAWLIKDKTGTMVSWH